MDIDPAQFAARWAAAWNAHDVEAVLAHFHEEAAFTSPFAAQVMPETGMSIRRISSFVILRALGRVHSGCQQWSRSPVFILSGGQPPGGMQPVQPETGHQQAGKHANAAALYDVAQTNQQEAGEQQVGQRTETEGQHGQRTPPR